MEQHAADIRWKVTNIVNDHGVFGITDYQKIFGQHPESAYINLYFDGQNASGRALALIRKVRNAVSVGEKAIQQGKKPSIPKDVSPYLQVVKNGASWEIKCLYDAWQKAVDGQGFSSTASSEDLGA